MSLPTLGETIIILLIVLSVYGAVNMNRAGDLLGHIFRRLFGSKD